MAKFKNTLQRGSVRCLIFREGDTWYGAALEFNIVEDASNPREAFLFLNEAVTGYLEAAQKIKARPHILNQTPDPEYEALWNARTAPRRKTLNVYLRGTINFPQHERDLVPA